jgi:uncharacterized protein YjbJ (UPF0337 family)
MTKFAFDSSWNQIKGKLRQKYGQLTDDDVEFTEGKGEELLGRLQAKLNLGANELAVLLRNLKTEVETSANSGPGAIDGLKARATEMAGGLKDAVSARAAGIRTEASALYEDGRLKAQSAYGEVEDYVRREPINALATALVAGFIVGLLLPTHHR